MAADAAKKLILVVDDEGDVRTYLTTLLKDNGYETMAASNGNEAMDIIKQKKPDLITLDMSMPEKSGVKVYREVKESDALKDTPVLVVTAVTGFGDKSEEFEKFISSRKHVPPPDGFIAKPIDREEFLARINQILG